MTDRSGDKRKADDDTSESSSRDEEGTSEEPQESSSQPPRKQGRTSNVAYRPASHFTPQGTPPMQHAPQLPQWRRGIQGYAPYPPPFPPPPSLRAPFFPPTRHPRIPTFFRLQQPGQAHDQRPIMPWQRGIKGYAPYPPPPSLRASRPRPPFLPPLRHRTPSSPRVQQPGQAYDQPPMRPFLQRGTQGYVPYPPPPSLRAPRPPFLPPLRHRRAPSTPRLQQPGQAYLQRPIMPSQRGIQGYAPYPPPPSPYGLQPPYPRTAPRLFFKYIPRRLGSPTLPASQSDSSGSLQTYKTQQTEAELTPQPPMMQSLNSEAIPKKTLTATEREHHEEMFRNLASTLESKRTEIKNNINKLEYVWNQLKIEITAVRPDLVSELQAQWQNILNVNFSIDEPVTQLLSQPLTEEVYSELYKLEYFNLQYTWLQNAIEILYNNLRRVQQKHLTPSEPKNE